MDRIGVFAKPPVPGRVKTRLSPALPPAEACALYEGMLADALDSARAAPAAERWLWWADAPGVNVAAFEEGFAVHTQPAGDLGVRLAHAFERMLARDGDRAVIIGADCPDLDAATIAGAFEALASNDAVVAPAGDGGYVLVGLSRPARELFQGIAWSTDRVLVETRARAHALGIGLAELDAFEDLDAPGDLLRWIAGPRGEGGRHTRDALARMGLLPANG